MDSLKKPYTAPKLRSLSVGDPRVWSMIDSLLGQPTAPNAQNLQAESMSKFYTSRARTAQGTTKPFGEGKSAQGVNTPVIRSAAVRELIVQAALKLASCDHKLASLIPPSTCGLCGSVYLQGVGWAQPMLIHSLHTLIEAAQEAEKVP